MGLAQRLVFLLAGDDVVIFVVGGGGIVSPSVTCLLFVLNVGLSSTSLFLSGDNWATPWFFFPPYPKCRFSIFSYKWKFGRLCLNFNFR